MRRRTARRIGRRLGLVRVGKRRGMQAVALISAGMLVVSGLSINALTAGIEIAAPAIGQPAHSLHGDGQLRRGPVPRAAFPALLARGPAAAGGDRIYDIDVGGTSYRVHEFTNAGSHTLVLGRAIDVEYLIVAGGGGGGAHVGGGGGGGGVLTGTTQLTSDTTIVVGAGGTGAIHYGQMNNTNVKLALSGGASQLGSLSASGGGHGGSWDWQLPAEGGSGGGSGNGAGASGTNSQGFAGGNGRGMADDGYPTGGGGGAGATGGNWSTTRSGDGGAGVASSIAGIETRYGGGGGGGIHGHWTGVNAAAGSGRDGGGNGAALNATLQATQNGTNGLGGGGGGGGNPSNQASYGGNGGSGIVIVRYTIPRNVWAPVAGTGGNTMTDVTIDGERYREHRFTTAGDHTLNLAIENPATQVEMLVVGGGGGGGIDSGGGGGGGALLEGSVTFTEAGDRTMTVTVGSGGTRGRWTSPRQFGQAGGNSQIVVTRGQVTEVNATSQGGRGGSTNDQNSINNNGGVNTGAGGVAPSTPTVNGAAWQGVTARTGGGGGAPSATGYATHADGKPAPVGGGSSTLFGGTYGGGAGGGSSARTVTAAGTNGGGRGSGTNTSVLDCNLRATAGTANTGGGGGAGSAHGSSSACSDGLNTRDGEPGGSGIVIVRYPLTRTISSLPSVVRELVVAEGRSTAQLRWMPPAVDPPAASSSGYKLEYSPVNGSTWTTVTTPVTFTTTGSGALLRVIADVTGIPTSSRHRFRVTPIGSVDGPPALTEPIAKGGDIVQFVGDDVVHQYTTVGNADFTLFELRTVQALLVGGGGGGGGRSGGGGGAGGVADRTGSNAVAIASGSYAIVVGGGGAGGAGSGVTGTNGSNSTALSLTALGGGGGGSDNLYSGYAGGSGGGGRYGSNGAAATQPTSASGGLGHSGGFGTGSNTWMGGGGGGAGGPGVNGTTTVVGDGGPGVNFASVFGTSVGVNGWFAGGGGGGSHDPSPSVNNWGFGGVGGGGNGGQCVNCAGSAGTANTGGGGGAGSTDSGSGGSGGDGGSGTVVLRYALGAS